MKYMNDFLIYRLNIHFIVFVILVALSCIFITLPRNLSFDVDDEALFEFFSRFGPLEFAKVVIDPATKHSRGSGFVKFVEQAHAAVVLSKSALIEVCRCCSLLV